MNNQITTKAEILTAMSQYGACAPAVKYVRAQPDTATAREIWTGCDRTDWLAWFGSSHRPAALEAFAFGCADRAVRVYAAEALARVGRVDEAGMLRALAPIVDLSTAHVGADAARAAARAVDGADDGAEYAAHAAEYAAHAAEYAAADAVRDAAYSAARHASASAAHAGAVIRCISCSLSAAVAIPDTEERTQLNALHALADAVLIGA